PIFICADFFSFMIVFYALNCLFSLSWVYNLDVAIVKVVLRSSGYPMINTSEVFNFYSAYIFMELSLFKYHNLYRYFRSLKIVVIFAMYNLILLFLFVLDLLLEVFPWLGSYF
ncbi:hypothetical protein TorRG33x02_148580, partial [Trema orientale]